MAWDIYGNALKPGHCEVHPQVAQPYPCDQCIEETPRITCPRCGMTSYNPNDIREGYCGNCHDWTSRTP